MSCALLAPNPHQRQPWLAELGAVVPPADWAQGLALLRPLRVWFDAQR